MMYTVGVVNIIYDTELGGTAMKAKQGVRRAYFVGFANGTHFCVLASGKREARRRAEAIANFDAPRSRAYDAKWRTITELRLADVSTDYGPLWK